MERGKRHQILMQGQGVWQGVGFLADMSGASCQDLQATVKTLEAVKQNASTAPQAVLVLERIQQVKDAIYRCDPLHVQIIGRAVNTVKNRRGVY